MNSAAPAVSRILISSVISLLFACAAGSKAQGNQPVGKDVVYKTVDGKTMHLYISSPPESISGPHAAIVFFHGAAGPQGRPRSSTGKRLRSPRWVSAAGRLPCPARVTPANASRS